MPPPPPTPSAGARPPRHAAPVFVDQSGRRQRRMTVLGLLSLVPAVAFAATLGASVIHQAPVDRTHLPDDPAQPRAGRAGPVPLPGATRGRDGNRSADHAGAVVAFGSAHDTTGSVVAADLSTASPTRPTSHGARPATGTTAAAATPVPAARVSPGTAPTPSATPTPVPTPTSTATPAPTTPPAPGSPPADRPSQATETPGTGRGHSGETPGQADDFTPPGRR